MSKVRYHLGLCSSSENFAVTTAAPVVSWLMTSSSTASFRQWVKKAMANPAGIKNFICWTPSEPGKNIESLLLIKNFAFPGKTQVLKLSLAGAQNVSFSVLSGPFPNLFQKGPWPAVSCRFNSQENRGELEKDLFQAAQGLWSTTLSGWPHAHSGQWPQRVHLCRKSARFSEYAGNLPVFSNLHSGNRKKSARLFWK